MTSFVELILLLLGIYRWVIIAAAVVTWIPSVPPYHPVARFLNKATDPVLRPIRAILPPEKTGYIDFSPIVALVALEMIRQLLEQALIRSAMPVSL